MVPVEVPSVLHRISPSLYVSATRCAMRELWSASRVPPALPVSAYACLGSVIHRLFEKAGNGELDTEPSSVHRAWEELVAKKERQMQDDGLLRPLVPLKRSVRDFEVRKLRSEARAVEIASSCKPYSGGGHERSLGPELWVESEDGLVGGYIDNAYLDDQGVVLQDFKSGALTETIGEASPVPKPGYVRQLQMYAALYRDHFDVWPTSLELVPLTGEPLAVPCDHGECSRVLDDAKSWCVSINMRLKKLSGQSSDAVIASLAEPSPDVCAQCVYRPHCEPYYAARSADSGDTEWPIDLFGEITGRQALKNGTLALRVRDESGKEFNIRNVSPDNARHPTAGSVCEGRRVAFFNLSRTKSPVSFLQNERTVVYIVSSISTQGEDV